LLLLCPWNFRLNHLSFFFLWLVFTVCASSWGKIHVQPESGTASYMYMILPFLLLSFLTCWWMLRGSFSTCLYFRPCLSFGSIIDNVWYGLYKLLQ
jgi:hypothetical protein